MKKRVIHIFAVCAALCLLVGCSCGGPKVISRGDMSQIYAEMLVVDQWLLENSKYRTQADTSLVYEPIFQKYGYTTEDYRASLEYYMNDPERYSRILRETVEILGEQIDELKELKAIEDRLKAIVPYKMDPARLYFGRSEDRLWNYGDSISVAMDTVFPVFELSFHEVSDTLAVTDTLVVKDSLALKDTLVKEADPVLVKESAIINAKPVATTAVQPNLVLTTEPQKISSTTLDSLKRK